MKYRNLILALGMVSLLNYYCHKKYLDKPPLGQLVEAAIANKRGVEFLLIGAYSLLDGVSGTSPDWTKHWYSAASNWVYGSIAGSEAYTGSDPGDIERQIIVQAETFVINSANEALAVKWSIVYDGVQRTNDVLRIMAKATDISATDQKRIAAEARFLRAHYHFEATKIWNKVPFIDETITYENGNYHVGNENYIWHDIENDLKYAMDNLNAEPYGGAIGRATKNTAMALLAKAYMFQKKFDLARPLLLSIINNPKYDLIDNYHENFNPATKNSKESIFSVQMSVNDGADGLNGNYGDLLNFPFNGGPSGCCGYFSPSQYLVNHFKTDPTTGLPDLDSFNVADVKYDSAHLSSADPFAPDTITLDPRLDWTIGRRGIPYLDWGNHPGRDWIRDPIFDGPYSPKKNAYYRYQQNILTDKTFWSGGTTTNNVNLIRYADVLLWAAEIEIEAGNLNLAREYINKVRRRAANPAGWVKKADGTPAANYKIGEYTDNWNDKDFALKALRYERVLELAMEGHRFFDLVRWGIASTEIKAYLDTEKLKRLYLNDIQFTKNKNEYFPIPQLQIDLSAGLDGIPKMIQNPGY